jgi:hypothetical protein
MENEAEEELYDQVGSCLGSFLKSFGDAALPYVEGLMPHIAPLLDKARPDEERRIALCIIDDMMEHSPAGRDKYLTQVCGVFACARVCVSWVGVLRLLACKCAACNHG